MKSEVKALTSVGEPPATPASKGFTDAAERALWVGVLVYVFAYVVLFAVGFRFLIYKTAIMPIFVIYGALLRDRKIFLADWLPFLSGTVLFDAMRGAIFFAVEHGIRPLFALYPIRLEQILFRTAAAPLVLQKLRNPKLDAVAVFFHGSHFAFFLLFGLALWHVNRAQFGYYRRVLLLTMAGGLIGYMVVPTVPPWLAAAQFNLLPPVDHVVVNVYTHYFHELYGAFDSNPVAAMPSLHAAFPTACSIIAWRTFGRRASIIVGVYATCVILAVMYLGEHYAVDVVAGIFVAAAASQFGKPYQPARVTFTESIVLTAVTLGATIITLVLSR